MSAEIANSPAKRLFSRLGSEGNDNTSVGLSALRNWRLRDRISALPVTSTFTVCLSRTDRLARNTKRSSVAALMPAILFRKITNLSSTPLRWQFLIVYIRADSAPTNKRAPNSALFPAKLYSPMLSSGLVESSGLFVSEPLTPPASTFSRPKAAAFVLGDVGFMFVIGADDALHQMMTDHIGLVEVDEGQAFNSLQNINGLEQPAAASIRQINLGDVSGNSPPWS